MLQIGDDQTQFVIDTRGLDISCLKKYFESKEWLKIFHNAKFDVQFLRFTFGFQTENVYDTFLGECCLTNGIDGRSLGLTGLTAKYCNGAILDKTERGRFISLGSKPYTHSNIIYGARDVEFLFCIRDKQMAEIERWGIQDVVELECQVVLALSDIEYNGMQLDATKWIELANKAINSITEIEAELDAMVMQEPKLAPFRKKYVQQDMFEGGITKHTTIKWTSPLQVAKVLKAIGIDAESTGEDKITKYQNKYPLVKKFIDYKHEQKLATTYGPAFLQYINKNTGRIHTTLWQILETGRISSKEPNLQQLPTKAEKINGEPHSLYLECFVAPKGYKLVSTDFSGQEARVAAQGSQDPVWIATFNEGRDLHAEVASMIFGIPVEQARDKPEYAMVGTTKVYLRGKSFRDVAKTLNFGMLFGMTEFKLSNELGIEEYEAKAIIVQYYSVLPILSNFLTKCSSYAVINKYIRTIKPYSLIRYFHNADISDRKIRGEIERAGRNTPIQGCSAMMTKLAMVKLREKIKEVPYKVELIMSIHDCILTYVEENHAEDWGVIQKEVMEEAGRVWLKSIPCVSDLKVSDYWEK
jgi:DNA polymerase I-like protein with 3'-5' exonuclease and polymerase domains